MKKWQSILRNVNESCRITSSDKHRHIRPYGIYSFPGDNAEYMKKYAEPDELGATLIAREAGFDVVENFIGVGEENALFSKLVPGYENWISFAEKFPIHRVDPYVNALAYKVAGGAQIRLT